MAARQVPVTVYAEMTPNPEVMKFVANKVLNPGAPLDYSSSDDTAGSPLAEAVLNFPFVEKFLFLLLDEFYKSLFLDYFTMHA